MSVAERPRGDADRCEELAPFLGERTPVLGITGLARVALAREDFERSGLLWGAISEQAGGMLGPRAMRWRDELRAETRPGFLSAVERGRDLELWEAAAFALADPAPA